MKNIFYPFLAMLFLFCAPYAEAVFWGSVSGGYTSDDNYYKDAFKYKNTGYCYGLNLNTKSKLTRGLNYDASYLLLEKQNTDLTWEDNITHNVKLNLTARPSDVFNVRLLNAWESQSFKDAYTKKYGYTQYKTGIEIPLYLFDRTTPKIGYSYEKISSEDFNYDSTIIGPLFELQQELSPWTMLTFSIDALDRDYPKQNLYESITTTGSAVRKDTESYPAVTLSSVINKNWNFSTGVRISDIRSNANLSVFDPTVDVSSRTLVADYYSYAGPSVFFETVFYPVKRLSCLAGCTYQEKAYSGNYAADSLGGLLAEKRKDKRYIVTAGLSYKLLDSVAVKADYSYENSSSNDYIYTYSNSIFLTGLTVYF